MQTIRVFKKTDDNWYPSHRLKGYCEGVENQNLVEVSFLKLHGAPSEWRVCCWGNDDMGLEKDFDKETKAWEVFLQVISLPRVNQNILIEQFKFRNA